MKVAVVALLVVVALASSASAGVLLRAPQFDSAVIKSDRLGGNFAYSSVEGHAYQAINPVVQHVATPVAVSYHATPVQVPVEQQQIITYQAAPVLAAAPALHAVSALHASPVLLARK